MKKSVLLFTTLFIVFAMILAACTSSGGSETAEEDADCSSEDVFCVGLVTDVGEVDDKSFNQSAWEGVQQAGEELGAKIDYNRNW